MYRWMLRHSRLYTGLYTAVLIAAGFALVLLFDWPPVPLFLGIFFLVLLCQVPAFLYAFRRLNATVKIWNEQGDPRPMLAEATDQLTYVSVEQSRLTLQIDQSIALLYTGDAKAALSVLESISDKVRIQKTPYIRVLFANNMSYTCLKNGDRDAAWNWLQTAIRLIEEGKWNPKVKELLQNAITDTGASVLCARGDYEKAKTALARVRAKAKCEKVGIAMTEAKIAIGEGQTDTAREKLRYVIEANISLFVTEARDLLAKLEEPTEPEQLNEPEQHKESLPPTVMPF